MSYLMRALLPLLALLAVVQAFSVHSVWSAVDVRPIELQSNGERRIAAGEAVQVVTAQGSVVGTVEQGGVAAFKGIPYAEPPVGPLRFRPPVPHAPWNESLHATEYGASCLPPLAFGSPFLPADEDCLFLNVFSPAEALEHDALFPVMVWIHGGGYIKGTSSLYNPRSLVQQGVVVVSMNYRLGALGFMALPEMGDELNMGFLDQRLALQWVQDNIAAFGGDAADVTIFGESAGAGSVANHLVMKRSWPLFSAAIAQSTYWLMTPLERAYEQGAEVVNGAGCGASSDVLSCLQAADVEELRKELAPVWGYGELPSHTITLWRNNQYHEVPVVMGVCAQEGNVFVNTFLGNPFAEELPMSDQQYNLFMEGLFGLDGLVPFASELYEPLRVQEGNFKAMSQALGDYWITCATQMAINTTVATTSPMYSYVFTQPTPKLGHNATHGTDLFYLFGAEFEGDNEKTRELIVQWWSSFAMQHAPSATGATWAPYDPRASGGSITTIGIPVERVSSVHQFYCSNWDAHYFSRLG